MELSNHGAHQILTLCSFRAMVSAIFWFVKPLEIKARYFVFRDWKLESVGSHPGPATSSSRRLNDVCAKSLRLIKQDLRRFRSDTLTSNPGGSAFSPSVIRMVRNSPNVCAPRRNWTSLSEAHEIENKQISLL